MIFDELQQTVGDLMIDPLDPTRRRSFDRGETHEDLLVPVFRGGKRVYEPPPLEEVRARRARELSQFHHGIKRFANPHRYPVGIEQRLFELKTRLIFDARDGSRTA